MSFTKQDLDSLLLNLKKLILYNNNQLINNNNFNHNLNPYLNPNPDHNHNAELLTNTRMKNNRLSMDNFNSNNCKFNINSSNYSVIRKNSKSLCDLTKPDSSAVHDSEDNEQLIFGGEHKQTIGPNSASKLSSTMSNSQLNLDTNHLLTDTMFNYRRFARKHNPEFSMDEAKRKQEKARQYKLQLERQIQEKYIKQVNLMEQERLAEALEEKNLNEFFQLEKEKQNLLPVSKTEQIVPSSSKCNSNEVITGKFSI